MQVQFINYIHWVIGCIYVSASYAVTLDTVQKEGS